MLELNLPIGFGDELRIFADEWFLLWWFIGSICLSLLISWYFKGRELRLMWLGARWWFSPFGLCQVNFLLLGGELSIPVATCVILRLFNTLGAINLLVLLPFGCFSLVPPRGK